MRISLSAMLLSVLFFWSCQKSGQAPVPNVIFILADDLGYSELGCYGNTFNETPSIDQLAENGLLYTDAYASAPVCSPFRASLMTGQHPARIGITDYLRPHEDRHLSEDYTTIAEIFQQKGYSTGMIGKWHLSGYENNGAIESGPGKHGFEDVILTERRGISGGSYFHPYHFSLGTEQKIFPEEHLTERVNLEAVDFIERNKDRSFFLYKSHYSVHTNLNGKPSIVDGFSQKPGAGLSPESDRNNVHLAAQLKSIDDGVEMIVDKLRECGLLENTIIIFMSDNGGETNVTSNAPLRAGKSTLYEGGIRVPMIVQWPEKITDPGRVSQAVSNMDYLTTFAELLDYDLENVQYQDGKSILGTWTGQASSPPIHEELFWHYPLVAPHFLGGFSSGAVREGNYKLIEDYTTKEISLYDLSKDIGEENNLSDELPDVRDKLYGDLKAWREDLNLEAAGHSKAGKNLTVFPDPYGPDVILDINGKDVPFVNYGVDLEADGTLVFKGKENFLKLLHIYIPDVTAKSVEMGATVNPDCEDGVILTHGEEVFGLSLYLKEGKVCFSTRKYGKLSTLRTDNPVSGSFDVMGKLSSDGVIELFVNGELIGKESIGESLPIPPDDPLSIGADFRRLVGEYENENFFKGRISNISFLVSG
jgi:arylsulfatase A